MATPREQHIRLVRRQENRGQQQPESVEFDLHNLEVTATAIVTGVRSLKQNDAYVEFMNEDLEDFEGLARRIAKQYLSPGR